MAEIINLRLARKAKVRAKAEQHAATNRAHYGRTKAEKQAAAQEAERLVRSIDGARRDRPGRDKLSSD